MPISLVTWARLFGGVALLLGNSFFVTTEFAMTRVRQFETEAFFGNGRGLERAWNMTERLEIFLTGCQVGITICSVGRGLSLNRLSQQCWSPCWVQLASPAADTQHCRSSSRW